MTNEHGARQPAHGQAWNGDWRARVAQRLAVRGHASVSSLSDAHPEACTLALADMLSVDEHGTNCADVAAVQVAELWRAEAKEGGAAEVERMARRNLLGELRSMLPDGLPSDWDESDNENEKSASFRFVSAGTSWLENIGQDAKPNGFRVLQAMIDAGRTGMLPAGWRPVDDDDPQLVAFFMRYWNAPT